MSSLLQGQIDFLDEQLGSLHVQDGHSLGDVEEAVELLLLLYEQIRIAEHRVAADPSSIILLYVHWLRGADQITPVFRALKARGHRLVKTPEFMKACLRARAVSSGTISSATARALPLEEVQRELQGRG